MKLVLCEIYVPMTINEMSQLLRISLLSMENYGVFFYCSALKMPKCQLLKEISELFRGEKKVKKNSKLSGMDFGDF